MELFINYPIVTLMLVFGLAFLLKNHIFATPLDVEKVKKEIVDGLKKDSTFVTPAELAYAKTEIKKDVEDHYLAIAVFKEFKRGIDSQFETVFKRFDEGTGQFKELFRGINDIKNYLMKEKNK